MHCLKWKNLCERIYHIRVFDNNDNNNSNSDSDNDSDSS